MRLFLNNVKLPGGLETATQKWPTSLVLQKHWLYRGFYTMKRQFLDFIFAALSAEMRELDSALAPCIPTRVTVK